MESGLDRIRRWKHEGQIECLNDFRQMKTGAVKWRTVWGRKKIKEEELRWTLLSCWASELPLYHFRRAPQLQSRSRVKPQGRHKIRDDSEKTKERKWEKNRLEKKTLCHSSLHYSFNPWVYQSDVGAITWWWFCFFGGCRTLMLPGIQKGKIQHTNFGMLRRVPFSNYLKSEVENGCNLNGQELFLCRVKFNATSSISIQS